jgi:hypothetical protein
MNAVKSFLVLAAGAVTLPLAYNLVRLAFGRSALELDSLGWEAAVILVMGCALAFPASRSRWKGWRLAGALFVLIAGVNALLVTFEMLVFTRATDVGGLVAWWLCRAACLSVIVVASLGKWGLMETETSDSSTPHLSFAGWSWRVGLAVISYTVLFMVAGLLIMRLEAVPDYTSPDYAAAPATANADANGERSEPDEVRAVHVPEPPVIFGFIFARGLACIVFTLPLLRSLRGGCWTAGLSAGLALAVLGGIAPLLAPNAEMTTGARLGHMLEIGWSNLAYGLVLGWLFGNRRRPAGHLPPPAKQFSAV